MKRYSKEEIKSAFENGEHLKVEGFVTTASVEITDTEYNQTIVDSGKEYGQLYCIPYSESGEILSYLPMPLKDYIRIYG